MSKRLGLLAASLSLVVGVSAASKVVVIGAGRRPALAAGSGRLHLVYQGLQKGDNLYYRSSSDGIKWSAETNVSNTPDISVDPAISANQDGTVCVAWLENCRDHKSNDIYASVSQDNGKTWSKAVDVSHTPGRSAYPAVAAGPNGELHLLWSDTTESRAEPDIFYAHSSDGGNNWSKARSLAHTHKVVGPPQLALGSDHQVYAVWSDATVGSDKADIFAIHGSGDKWSEPANISNSKDMSSDPSVAITSDGKVCVAWLEDCPDHSSNDIYYSLSGADGKFAKSTDLSHTPGLSSQPQVATDTQGHLLISWIDTSLNPKVPDVWQSHWDSNSASFTPAQNVSMTPGISQKPKAAWLAGKAATVWEEQEQGKSWIKCLPH